MPNSTLQHQKKEELTNELLIFMKNKAECIGRPISGVTFDFHLEHTAKYFGEHPDEIIPEGGDLTEFKKIVEISDEEFKIIMNYCQTHAYVKKACVGRSAFDFLLLTTSGMARANSAEKAKHYQPQSSPDSSIVFNGPVNATNFQAGNNNTQNITNTISYLIEEIEKADATPEEKKTAISKLKDFLNNPIVSGILAGCGVEGIKYWGGL